MWSDTWEKETMSTTPQAYVSAVFPTLYLEIKLFNKNLNSVDFSIFKRYCREMCKRPM